MAKDGQVGETPFVVARGGVFVFFEFEVAEGSFVAFPGVATDAGPEHFVFVRGVGEVGGWREAGGDGVPWAIGDVATDFAAGDAVEGASAEEAEIETSVRVREAVGVAVPVGAVIHGASLLDYVYV